MTSLDDEQLAKRAAKGDEKAFEELALRHASRVFKMAWKWCGNRADAEDITQEIFMKLARKMHLYKPEAKFTTWLYQVTLNEARDYYRREKRRAGYEAKFSQEQGEAGEPGKGLENAQENAQIRDLLHRLPDEQKEAVLLVVCNGLSHRDAAAILGCAEKTVTWRLFEARRKLKEWYGNVG